MTNTPYSSSLDPAQERLPVHPHNTALPGSEPLLAAATHSHCGTMQDKVKLVALDLQPKRGGLSPARNPGPNLHPPRYRPHVPSTRRREGAASQGGDEGVASCG